MTEPIDIDPTDPSDSTGSLQSWILQLRERLGAPPPTRIAPGKSGEAGTGKESEESRRAAVLVPLYVDAGQLWTVLTKRSEELPTHKGQVAFPGGSLEVGEDAWDAALRETHEELSLDTGKVVRIGQLDEAETPSGFTIVPCVGAIPHSAEVEANEEIAEVFSVPLLAFADVRVVEDRQVTIDGRERMIRVYHVGRHQVWGLTARIVQNLLERLGLETPLPA